VRCRNWRIRVSKDWRIIVIIFGSRRRDASLINSTLDVVEFSRENLGEMVLREIGPENKKRKRRKE